MGKFVVNKVKKDEYHLWDDLVQSSPQGTLFHTSDWLKTLESHTNSDLVILMVYLGDEAIAGIPFQVVEHDDISVLYSPIGNGMIQNLGPVFANYDELKQDKRQYYFVEFQKAIDNYINENYEHYQIMITTPPNLIDARPYLWNGYQATPKYNNIADISDLASLWDGFKKELRKNIKNAEKAEVEVVEGGLDDFIFVVESLTSRLEEQELKMPVSMEYMRDLYNKIGNEKIKVMVAKKHGKMISGIIYLAFKDKISIWVGATKADIKGIYPVDLLQWKIMEWGHERGYGYCDILGANMPSNSFFKSRYNFDLDPYYYVTKQKTTSNGSIIKRGKKVAKSVYKKIKDE